MGVGAAVASLRECGSCGSGHCCGSGRKIQKKGSCGSGHCLWRLERGRGFVEVGTAVAVESRDEWEVEIQAPVGAGTAAASEKRMWLQRKRAAAAVGKAEKSPAGADSVAAVGECGGGFCGSGVLSGWLKWR
ncbi:hypothetical protein ROHU_010868 [Labeo rohita]|uniref:Uncharacterized protein n=1 Tax=Labeo rohita TaxID=84645 RepID=A0A498LQC4_LABRO|nr:hypothetical protein ROHU_010868 [Labeo rohita]